MESSGYVLLGIPIPFCMRQFVRHVPQPIGSDRNDQVGDLITVFGTAHKKGSDEIQKCRLLAQGLDDMVVLLERPALDHEYSMKFGDFVARSPTLRTVDELIRFATASKRNISNVCILDILSFKPIGAELPLDEECHKLVQHILQIRKPKVILGCSREISISQWFGNFQAGNSGVARDPCWVTMDDGRLLYIPSFHPGYCVNHVTWCANSRIMLAYHFVLAFSDVKEPYSLPSWISSVSQFSHQKYVDSRLHIHLP